MSFLCSIEKSTSGSLVSSIGPRHVLPFLCPLEYKNDYQQHIRHFSQKKHSSRQLRRSPKRPTAQLDTWFITSLVKAGHCAAHSQPRSFTRNLTTHELDSLHYNRSSRNGVSHTREYFTQSSAAIWRDNSKEEDNDDEKYSQEELLSLVETYDGDSLTDQLPLLQPPDLKQFEDYPKPSLRVSNDLVDAELSPNCYTWPAQGQAKADVHALQQYLKHRAVDAEKAYQLYKSLPAPRIPYIEPWARHALLANLSRVEHKDETAMLRYFSVVDDLNSRGIPLSISEWTSAISFAGRYVSRTGDVEIQAGLRMWREMEHVAGVPGNHVTFNVLFDIAAKAGKFKLAEMIYTEMQKRGYEYNRFHHVSLIHFYGLKQDGSGARQAYRHLVESREIVDTVVLNAVIGALIRAGEGQSAELIYERMKRLHFEKRRIRLPSTDFRKKRSIAKQLLGEARHAKKTNEKQQELYQKNAVVAPDIKTYRILIHHHAITSGDFGQVSKYLEEMKLFSVPVHAGIFLSLFKGFALHGGVRYTLWTAERLDSVWNAFMLTVNQVEDLYLGKWMILWALRAFAKCFGKEKVVDIWEECKMSWQPRSDELDIVNEELQVLLDIRPGIVHQSMDEYNELY